MRNTKIVCTIGPASGSRETLGRLMDAGMNVVRLNFSHGTLDDHAQKIALIRELAAEKGLPIAILQDLSGPKIRTGAFAGGPVELKTGEVFTLTSRDVPGDEREVSLTYPALPEDVQPGDTLLLADGALELRVENVTGPDIRCRVILGGQLSSHKGINLPSRSIRAPILTRKDREDLAFGLEQGVDYVALSFVRSAADIETAREAMRAHGRERPIIAKIEKHEALAELDAIIAAVDGVMVARGDLGVDIPPEKVPTAQRRIIEKANLAGQAGDYGHADAQKHDGCPAADARRSDRCDQRGAGRLGCRHAVGGKRRRKVPGRGGADHGADCRRGGKGPLRGRRGGQRLARIVPPDASAALARAACGLAETIHAKALLIATQSGTTARLAPRSAGAAPFWPARWIPRCSGSWRWSAQCLDEDSRGGPVVPPVCGTAPGGQSHRNGAAGRYGRLHRRLSARQGRRQQPDQGRNRALTLPAGGGMVVIPIVWLL